MMQPNIDQNEVAKFNAQASRWWDKSGEFKPLHEINPLRLGFIKQQTKLTNQKILDVGCGGGILAESLANEGGIVTGIDAGADTIEIAKAHAQQKQLNIDYLHTTIEEFAKHHAHSFDIVTCMELLEHVPSPQSIIQSCKKLVRPNGLVFFSTINRNPKAFLHAIIGAEYVLRMLPRGTHQYGKFVKPSEIDAWARIEHMQLQKISGMTYSPITQKYSLTPDVSVNYLVSYKSEQS